MPSLIDDEDRTYHKESFEMVAYGFDALYYRTTTERFDYLNHAKRTYLAT
jgi:hypothetical protein